MICSSAASRMRVLNRNRAVALRKSLSEQQNHRCCYCGCRLTDGPLCPTKATLEHVQAKVDGGLTNYWNCVVACYRCNCTRGRQNPTQFFLNLLNAVAA